MKKYSITKNPGKIKGLRNISLNGLIHISALDHRGSFLELFDNKISAEDVRSIKKEILDVLEKESSAILLDPNYGFGLGSRNTGSILALESTGSINTKGYKETLLLDNWNVDKIKRSGASGVKLVLYINPESHESVTSAHRLAKSIATQCLNSDILFLLEPIIPKDLQNRGTYILKAIEQLSDIEADVFKIEYPGAEYINKVDTLLEGPWALLSGGINYFEFKEAFSMACSNGCSGYVAGRSLWKEIGHMNTRNERKEFLEETVLPRFLELKKIAQEIGNAIWTKITIEESLTSDWYAKY